MDLVSKKEYPIYYQLIKNPISMNMIKKRIYSNYYDNILEFENDFHLMFDNARTFNEEGSAVYEDADEMEVRLKLRRGWTYVQLTDLPLYIQKAFEKELENQCPGGQLPNLLHRQKMNPTASATTTATAAIGQKKKRNTAAPKKKKATTTSKAQKMKQIYAEEDEEEEEEEEEDPVDGDDEYYE